ncbi:hypothetical protein C6568_16400 [Melaminivora suipulveris]|uniref:Uncharacterized protein n=1 Tax=Melaminivora suipulveris TaxID=2109913 RepID=A0A2R3QFT7_9BURK|nr:hypothetical protein [Melaminivora suipulveris]AVO50638.1 hypothetical protein C6568_16400 [Melaminivora suipulveris]
MRTATALTQETIFGMADGATYSGMLCLEEDGKRYFFSQAQVDGEPVTLPHARFDSREDALRGLASVASGTCQTAHTARQPTSDRT